MLDEKDLQAFGALIDTKLAQQKNEIIGETTAMFAQQKTEIIGETTTIMDTKVKESESRMMAFFEASIMPKFDLLADSILAIDQRLGKMPTKEDLESLERRIDALEAMVRKHSQDISELKKAQ